MEVAFRREFNSVLVYYRMHPELDINPHFEQVDLSKISRVERSLCGERGYIGENSTTITYNDGNNFTLPDTENWEVCNFLYTELKKGLAMKIRIEHSGDVAIVKYSGKLGRLDDPSIKEVVVYLKSISGITRNIGTCRHHSAPMGYDSAYRPPPTTTLRFYNEPSFELIDSDDWQIYNYLSDALKERTKNGNH